MEGARCLLESTAGNCHNASSLEQSLAVEEVGRLAHLIDTHTAQEVHRKAALSLYADLVV